VLREIRIIKYSRKEYIYIILIKQTNYYYISVFIICNNIFMYKNNVPYYQFYESFDYICEICCNIEMSFIENVKILVLAVNIPIILLAFA
jgi:hypothetical protein